MKLKFNLSPEIEKSLEEDIIYALPYDLDFEGEQVDGFLVVTQTKLHLFKAHMLDKTYSLEALKDYEVEQFIGSGALKVTYEGEGARICALPLNGLDVMQNLLRCLTTMHKIKYIVTMMKKRMSTFAKNVVIHF